MSLSPNRPEVAVQPVQDFPDHIDPGWHVSRALEDHVPRLCRRTEQLKQWRLRRLDREVEIVSSCEEQNRHFDPR